MPRFGPVKRRELVQCPRQLRFRGHSREANINSWSRAVCASVSRTHTERTLGKIFSGEFSVRLGSKYRSGRSCEPGHILVPKGRRSVRAQEQRNKTSVDWIRRPEKNLLPRDPVLAEIVRRLVKVYEPELIYLFGSMARGDARPDSDYDILVLVEHPTEPLYRLSQGGFKALRGIDAAVDVVVWDRATFDARRHLVASFPATVVREGRLLHVAAHGSRPPRTKPHCGR